jgi:hypothetical protein
VRRRTTTVRSARFGLVQERVTLGF